MSGVDAQLGLDAPAAGLPAGRRGRRADQPGASPRPRSASSTRGAAGMASGINNTFRQVGIATGIAGARRDLPVGGHAARIADRCAARHAAAARRRCSPRATRACSAPLREAVPRRLDRRAERDPRHRRGRRARGRGRRRSRSCAGGLRRPRRARRAARGDARAAGRAPPDAGRVTPPARSSSRATGPPLVAAARLRRLGRHVAAARWTCSRARGRRALAVDLPGFGARRPAAPAAGPCSSSTTRSPRRWSSTLAAEDGEPRSCCAATRSAAASRCAPASGADLPLAGIVPVAPAGLDMPRWFRIIERDPIVRALLAAPVPLPEPLVRTVVGEVYRAARLRAPARGGRARSSRRSPRHHRDARRGRRDASANGRRLLPELHGLLRARPTSACRCCSCGATATAWSRHSGARHVLDALPDDDATCCSTASGTARSSRRPSASSTLLRVFAGRPSGRSRASVSAPLSGTTDAAARSPHPSALAARRRQRLRHGVPRRRRRPAPHARRGSSTRRPSARSSATWPHDEPPARPAGAARPAAGRAHDLLRPAPRLLDGRAPARARPPDLPRRVRVDRVLRPRPRARALGRRTSSRRAIGTVTEDAGGRARAARRLVPGRDHGAAGARGATRPAGRLDRRRRQPVRLRAGAARRADPRRWRTSPTGCSARAVYRALGGAPAPLVKRGVPAHVDRQVPDEAARDGDQPHDRDFLAQIEAVDHFMGNMHAYPGRTMGQLYHRFFRVNDLADGQLELGDHDDRPRRRARAGAAIAGDARRARAAARRSTTSATLLPGAPEVRLETGARRPPRRADRPRAPRRRPGRWIDEFFARHETPRRAGALPQPELRTGALARAVLPSSAMSRARPAARPLLVPPWAPLPVASAAAAPSRRTSRRA